MEKELKMMDRMSQIITLTAQASTNKNHLSNDNLKKYIAAFDKRYSVIVFFRQEAGLLHNSFEWGTRLYTSVKNQDTEQLKNLLFGEKDFHYGVLSSDVIRNWKDLSICAVVTVIHFALMERIIDVETAYSASDTCIQLLEEASSEEDILPITYASLYRLSMLIQENRQREYHHIVERTKKYIFNHFHEPIAVSAIATHLNVSAEHLSRTFRKVEGISVKKYIQNEKIEKAKNLLIYSDLSFSAISRFLGFSSQSHFSTVFKQYAQLSPGEFRKQFSENNQDQKDS